MSRPLKYVATGELREMTDTEIQRTFIIPILKEFAATGGTGTIAATTSSGTGTLLGTWTNRTRVSEVGDHGFTGVTNTINTTHNVYQNLSEVSESSMVRPLCFRFLVSRSATLTSGSKVVTLSSVAPIQVGMDVYGSGIPAGTFVESILSNTSVQLTKAATLTGTRTLNVRKALHQMTDSEIDTFIITPALDLMVASPSSQSGRAEGIGTYRLQGAASAPSTPPGGTWTSVYSFVDSFKPFGQTTIDLWRLTSIDNLPALSVRPLKFTYKDENVIGDEGLQRMSDSDILTLISRFRNKIVSTGKGKYAFQALAPSDGNTWSQRGVGVEDLLNAIDNLTYTRYFTGFYTRTYVGFFYGDYTGFYSGTTFIGEYRTASAYQTFGGGRSTRGSLGPWFKGAYAAAYQGAYTRNKITTSGIQVAAESTRDYAGLTVSSTLESIEVDYLWLRQT